MGNQDTRQQILVGRRAPDFEVSCTPTPGHPGRRASLRNYRDRWLVLMFYPQDFSLVCPTELLAISRGVAGREVPVLPTATLGSRGELRGRAALEPVIEPEGIPVRTIALWTVLLSSVAIVGGLALRLAREMRE